MVCVLGSRSTVLPDAWGDVCGSICLTVWVTQYRSTGCLGRCVWLYLFNRMGHAVPFYRMLGETTQGKGGSPAAIPLPLPGFLPQSPAFLLPHPPMGDDQALHVSTMLHKTQRGEIYFMKSWEPSKNIRSPQEWGELWKRERERKPVRGERISSLLRSLPSQRGCRSHTGRWVMRDPSG